MKTDIANVPELKNKFMSLHGKKVRVEVTFTPVADIEEVPNDDKTENS